MTPSLGGGQERETATRAFTVERYGTEDGLRAGEVPDPEVGAATLTMGRPRPFRWSP
ncbi:hypothetical protein Q7C01_19360 [Streptomyces sp. FXY-T5]|nr:hypothetical protein [Streptomyces sp. FXY-T5]WMD06412.1 hypothetical protein Q7C01_19360 [Streptomyces sp. FXY-T5]